MFLTTMSFLPSPELLGDTNLSRLLFNISLKETHLTAVCYISKLFDRTQFVTPIPKDNFFGKSICPNNKIATSIFWIYDTLKSRTK